MCQPRSYVIVRKKKRLANGGASVAEEVFSADPVLCTGCGRTIYNVDGCPVCGTDRHLRRGGNQ